MNPTLHPFVARLRKLGMQPHHVPRVTTFVHMVLGQEAIPAQLSRKHHVTDTLHHTTQSPVDAVEYLSFHDQAHHPLVAEAVRTGFLCGVSFMIGTPLWLSDDPVAIGFFGKLTSEQLLQIVEATEDHLVKQWRAAVTQRIRYLQPCNARHVAMLRRLDGDGKSVADFALETAVRHFRDATHRYASALVRDKIDHIEIWEHVLAAHLSRPFVGRMHNAPSIVLAME